MCLWPAIARAGNDDELLVGNHAAMLGGAVAATVRDSSSSWYNPAGLGAIDRDQVDVSATVYTLRAYSAPRLISTTSGAAKDGAVTEFVVAPTQIAYVRRLGPGASLGLGYFVPKASNYVLRESLRDRDSDTPSQWLIAGAGAEMHHTGVAAIGFAVTPRIRVGASLIGAYTTATQSFSLFGAVDSEGETRASNTISVLGTTYRMSVQLGTGLQLDLTPNVVVGVTYRSPELQLRSSFDSSLSTSVTSLIDLDDPRFGATAMDLKEKVGFELLTAGRAGLAVAVRYARGWVSAEVDMQPGLHRSKVDIDRKSVVNARLGWFHALSPAFALGVGLFSDRSPQANSYDFVDGTGDFYGGTLGIELSNEHQLGPEERAKSLVFSSVFALRYAYTSGDFGRVVADPEQIDDSPFQAVKGSIHIHELGLYVGGGLHF